MGRTVCPVLVGRERDLAHLSAALDSAQRGRGGMLLVAGPAGIGKSRLVGAVAERARERGMMVLVGRCVPTTVPAPYRPVVEALLSRSPGGSLLVSPKPSTFRSALAGIVPEWRDPTTPTIPESPVVVAEALLGLLSGVAGPLGCLLLLEDVHWADPETAHLLDYLDEASRIGARALEVAEDAGLAVWQVRTLHQLGVVEMFRSGSVDTLRQARTAAERIGALATATSLDVEIAAGLEAQFRVDEARRTCTRCIEMAHRLGLRGAEAVAHGFVAILEAGRGRRAAMEVAIERSLELAADDVDLAAALWGDARAIASLVAEDRPRARAELERAVALYRSPAPVVPRLPAALLALVAAADGDEADRSRATGITALNTQGAGYLAYADAVLLGRQGDAAGAAAAARRGDQHLALMPWYRNLVRRLAAEAAIRDSWGDPATWLEEAIPFFETAGNPRLAGACRGLLRRCGIRAPRPMRSLVSLPEVLRRRGVTPREAELLALLGDGLSNRLIAERLSLSERTVEQHVGSLKRRLDARNRAHLAAMAVSLGTSDG